MCKEPAIAAPPTFFLTAAEHSGDALGAALIAALRRQIPEARFAGVGGDAMAAAGCRLLANPVQRSAMLVGAFLTQTRYWWRLLGQIKRELAILKPNVVIPIDSSAINLHIARVAKAQGLKVCYYVAPQVWASRGWRIRKIQASVDTLCCVLPFEEPFFKERSVNAVYVGHPMFDQPVDTPQSDPARLEPPLPGLAEGAAPRVAIFPGSRRAEVDANMPPLLQVLAQIKGRFARVNFVAVAPSEQRAWQIRHHLRRANIAIDIRAGHADAILRWADLVLVKSGTTTLQAARHGKPMVVVFAVPRWQWALARHFIYTPYIALVNILAGRELVPEFIPFHGSMEAAARRCIDLLSLPERRAAMARELAELIAPLQPQGGVLASDRVANEVIKLLPNNK